MKQHLPKNNEINRQKTKDITQNTTHKAKGVKGVLYILATPIGNMGDITARAINVLSNVDFIAAEDTRVSAKLLNYHGIKKPMVSYYEHNLKQRGELILNRILNGENCALCSDAGTPAISDPGELIVADAHKMGIKIETIPGACAAIAALCVSGQITARFVFEGFLPTNKRQKQARINALLNEERTIIFYEAPHKLNTTLQDLLKAFGGEKSITICRELTKIHEEIKLTNLNDACEFYKNNAPKGEFVLVMQGTALKPKQALSIEQALQIAKSYMAQGLSTSAAAKKAASESGLSKSEIYKLCNKEN